MFNESLRKHEFRVTELVRLTKLSPTGVHSALSRLINKNLVMKSEVYGKYSLTTKGEEVAKLLIQIENKLRG